MEIDRIFGQKGLKFPHRYITSQVEDMRYSLAKVIGPEILTYFSNTDIINTFRD
jgi:hypothetical protein